MIYGLLVGLLIGMVSTIIWSRRRTYGTVIVYFPDDPLESPYLGFKVDKSTIDIATKNRVQFNVEIDHLDSQK